MIIVRQAVRSKEEHKVLCKIASTSKFTRDFSSIMFSPEAAYHKGWIRCILDNDGIIMGFTCVRHKVREPKTVLYFITVITEARSRGFGVRLMRDLEEETPHKIIELNVAHDNERALHFYGDLGYKVLADDAIHGTAWHLEKQL